MGDVIIFLVTVSLIFYGGMAFQKRISIDYKERWQKALKLMAELPEQKERTVIIKAPTETPADRKTRPVQVDQAFLHSLNGAARVQIEVNRLRAGLPPRDDLMFLNGDRVVEIETERVQQGWD